MAAKAWSLLTPAVDALKNTICGLIRDIKEHVQVSAGFYAEAQATPDKTIAIYAGVVYFGITKVEYAGLDVADLGTSGAFEVSALTADYYNKILFTIDSSGTLAATEGTEGVSAAHVGSPAIPAGKFPICMVTVQDDGTATAGTILTIEQSEIAQLQGFACVFEEAILYDGTKGRVLRKLRLAIADGTNATTIKPNCDGGENNATVISEEDNLGKSGDTGNFNLSAAGDVITIEAGGLDGNAVLGIGANVLTNASAVDLSVSLFVSGNNLLVNFANATTGAVVDLTTLVDTGAISVRLVYMTDA